MKWAPCTSDQFWTPIAHTSLLIIKPELGDKSRKKYFSGWWKKTDIGCHLTSFVLSCITAQEWSPGGGVFLHIQIQFQSGFVTVAKLGKRSQDCGEIPSATRFLSDLRHVTYAWTLKNSQTPCRSNLQGVGISPHQPGWSPCGQST